MEGCDELSKGEEEAFDESKTAVDPIDLRKHLPEGLLVLLELQLGLGLLKIEMLQDRRRLPGRREQLGNGGGNVGTHLRGFDQVAQRGGGEIELTVRFVDSSNNGCGWRYRG